MKMTIRMLRWALMAFLYLLVSVTLVSIQAGGAMAWSEDPTVNTPICTAPGDQDATDITSDGSGGAIITWADERSGDSDIYAQRVDSTGNVRWISNGVAICTASDYQYGPQLISDGSGGAIITWEDGRNGSDSDIYAQRVDSTGNVRWISNGIAICTASGPQGGPQPTPDGSGGAIITWHDYRNGIDSDIYAQRVDSTGTIRWVSNGAAICTASGDQSLTQLTSDGSGGAIITWEDGRNGSDWDVYAQRVDSTGNVRWIANGVAICTASGYQGFAQVTSDGSGGAIITWHDYRSFDPDIYAQRVDSTGTIRWVSNGVAVSTGWGYQWVPHLISDGSGGAIITWEDSPSGTDSNVYAQRVDSTGNVRWIPNGIAISTAPGVQVDSQLTSDGSGGAIITWGDLRNGINVDIYAQRVDSTGNTRWISDGIAICTAWGYQNYPQVTSDGSGGAIVAWADDRNDNQHFTQDIYAQRVKSDGTLGGSSGLMEGDVSGNGHVTVSDAMMIAQYKAGMITLTADQLLSADTNDDGNVTMADAMHIAQWLVDPTGSLGVLQRPLWQSPADDAMLPPVA